MEPFSDEKIVDAWHRNTAPWVAAVRGGQIESRHLVTDRAIVDAVSGHAPRTVLDIGCGEGWLARELATMGIEVIGVDAVLGLIEQARGAGGGDFHLADYEEIAAGKLKVTADVAVCNFSLLGKRSAEQLLGAIPSLLNADGVFVVQTLHPLTACGELPYRDGWREGSWGGCGPGFREPAPWYFRTLGGWIGLFRRSGLELVEMHEPLHPKSGQPASILFIARPAAARGPGDSTPDKLGNGV